MSETLTLNTTLTKDEEDVGVVVWGFQKEDGSSYRDGEAEVCKQLLAGSGQDKGAQKRNFNRLC